MNVRSLGNSLGSPTNSAPIFDDLFPLSHIPNGDLVPQGNILNGLDSSNFFTFKGYCFDLDAGHYIANDYSYVINFIVHQCAMCHD
jgi:hypothetical protein